MRKNNRILYNIAISDDIKLWPKARNCARREGERERERECCKPNGKTEFGIAGAEPVYLYGSEFERIPNIPMWEGQNDNRRHSRVLSNRKGAKYAREEIEGIFEERNRRGKMIGFWRGQNIVGQTKRSEKRERNTLFGKVGDLVSNLTR